MKYLVLAAALLTSAAFAVPATGPVTQNGTGSQSNSFQINATVGDACTMSQPGDVTIPVMYWTQSADAATGTTTVNVMCNTGANFRVDVSPTPITLTNSSTKTGTKTLTATVTGQSIGDESSGAGNAANTLLGYTKTLTVSVPKPVQDNIQGSYTGTATVTLSVLASTP
ncbi:hypothetical protein GCM10022631_21700 [Deinococcus rubellus]|uniref:Spore coat protein U domain-containing protein n=1 Tax=Deinococcus rubellus TaxID=1889240 RepID=A0ABY5YHC9_9DEIO|nr:hypothetical protein [Deinococcus rubellus]UWX64331.1 hypothetical protein N0D28_01250 [Deinococcus rubellus]